MINFKDIISSCQFLLSSFPKATDVKEYLNSRITAENQEKFQFGYFPDSSNINVLTDLVGEDYLKENNLLYSKIIEDALCTRSVLFSHFNDYPMIMPFKDCYGRIIGIVGRTLLSDTEQKQKKISKYKNTSGFRKGNHLFGLFENKKSILDNNCVYVVEGQFDVIKAMENGITNIVALGTSNMTTAQFSLILRYTNNIFLLLDNDEAGIKGRKVIMSKFETLANIKNFYLPEEFKDIDECLTATGQVSFIIKN